MSSAEGLLILSHWGNREFLSEQRALKLLGERFLSYRCIRVQLCRGLVYKIVRRHSHRLNIGFLYSHFELSSLLKHRRVNGVVHDHLTLHHDVIKWLL